MQEIITYREVSLYARDIPQNIEQKRIETFIRESENIDLKSALGDALFLDVKANPEKHTLLLDGGTYESCGKQECFTGLRTALAYYTYARVVKNADNNVTRFGFVQKESEYSSSVDFKEKMMAYNDAFSVADSYLKECLKYLQAVKEPLYKGGGGLKSNRVKFKVIGD